MIKIKYKERWKALIFVYIFMLSFVIVFQALPPLFGHIISTIGISHAQAGALMSLFGLPGIFIAIPGGILSDIYGSKKIGMLALVVAFLGALIVALGNSYRLLLIGRIIAGIGALTISVIAPQILTLWFDRREMGIAMGIFNTAMPLGTVLTLNTFGILAGFFTWRLPVLFTSFYCLFVFLLFYFRYPKAPQKSEKKEKPNFKKSIKGLQNTGLSIWLLAIIWMLYNASAISYLTFGGDYYTSIGYNSGYASFLTSLLMVGALIFSSFVGYLTDRFGKEEYFIIGGSALLGTVLLLIPRSTINPVVFGIMIGLAASLVPAPLFALVPKFLPPEKMGLGYGILASCLNIGVFVGPFFVGLLYDLSSNYKSGFNLMAGLAIAIILVTLFLVKNTSIEKAIQGSSNR